MRTLELAALPATGGGETWPEAPERSWRDWKGANEAALAAARAALGKRPKSKPPVGKRIAAVVAYARATPCHAGVPWTLAEVQVIAEYVLEMLGVDPVSDMCLAKNIQPWADGGPREVEPDAAGRRVRRQFYRFPAVRAAVGGKSLLGASGADPAPAPAISERARRQNMPALAEPARLAA